jgi:hypothetical protein
MSKFSQKIHLRPLPVKPTPVADSRRRQDQQLRVMSDMIDIGMNLMKTARQRVLDGDHDAIRSFPLIASAVAQATVLRDRLQSPQTNPAVPGPARRPTPADRDRQRKQALKTVMEGAVTAEAGGQRIVAQRLLMLDEWLDDPALDADLAKRTTGEVAVDMCRQLGIAPDIAKWPQDALWEAAIYDAEMLPRTN